MMASKDNESYYDEFAHWYENQRHEGYHAFIDRLESDLILPLSPGKDVLEVGCGTGLILQRVEPVARRAVGIDLSDGMLEHARRRGLEVYKSDVCSLPFDDEAFDVVYSFKVLAHVEDIDTALGEMSRVTRQGGKLVLEFYNKRSLRFAAKRMAGPGKISNHTDEGAVFTRWDSKETIVDRLPAELKPVDWAGVRVFTPAAVLHRVPVVSAVLQRAERTARDHALFKQFGGFLVVILEKR